MMFEPSNMFRKLKSVVVFLKIFKTLVLSRPFGKLRQLSKCGFAF